MAILDVIAKDHKEWIDVCLGFGAGDQAEDIVQDMYLKIAKSNIEERRNYRGYVFATLRNLCYDLHKNNRFDISLIENLTEDNCQTDGRLQWLDIQQALHNLPYFERQVIQLHKIEDISLCEIQRETGVCRSKMMKAKNKGIEKLKKMLNE